ncbi:hypothetical protein MSAN_01740600 [Mycena sanguinolenta]|uniref:Uncharacterized protein n=1 Tax=Mycena sanguinolenta TaxID=230812 RepID=A0A8H6XYL1_9AGAR|nr:hypothetical protein MSAN_01740600 [Mycena sanguinolenta]
MAQRVQLRRLLPKPAVQAQQEVSIPWRCHPRRHHNLRLSSPVAAYWVRNGAENGKLRKMPSQRSLSHREHVVLWLSKLADSENWLPQFSRICHPRGCTVIQTCNQRLKNSGDALKLPNDGWKLLLIVT